MLDVTEDDDTVKYMFGIGFNLKYMPKEAYEHQKIALSSASLTYEVEMQGWWRLWSNAERISSRQSKLKFARHFID